MATGIRLQVLSGGQAILADCLGYESEVFIPVIVNNHITLQNVVSSKRTLDQAANKIERNSFEKLNRAPDNVFKNIILHKKSPLAESTPEKIRFSKENRTARINSHLPIKARKLQNDSDQKTTSNNASAVSVSKTCQSQEFPSPDIIRRAVIQNKNDSVSIPGFQPRAGLKIVRLHRINTPNTPKNLARIIPSSKNTLATATETQVLRNLSNVSSFGNVPSLHITSESSVTRSPNQSFLVNSVSTPPTESSAIKWRKCLTPQRTYVRGNVKKTPLQIKRLSLKRLESSKWVNEFRINPTLPLKTSKPKVIVKPRKLIVDNNKVITPKSFKNQLKNTEDLSRSNYQLPKSRRGFDILHLTAFDLLTNSCYYPRIGIHLNSLFRKSCLNKHADTIQKYEPLTKFLPPLESSL